MGRGGGGFTISIRCKSSRTCFQPYSVMQYFKLTSVATYRDEVFRMAFLTQHSKKYENYIFVTLMVGQKILSH